MIDINVIITTVFLSFYITFTGIFIYKRKIKQYILFAILMLVTYAVYTQTITIKMPPLILTAFIFLIALFFITTLAIILLSK